MWRGKRTLNMMHGHVLDYPTPISLTWSWNWGSLAGIFLVVQVLTGLFLAVHYDSVHNFESVMGMISEVPGGAYMGIAHQNGATFFFAGIYVHMWRSFLYGSYVSTRWCMCLLCLVFLLCFDLFVADNVLALAEPCGTATTDTSTSADTPTLDSTTSVNPPTPDNTTYTPPAPQRPHRRWYHDPLLHSIIKVYIAGAITILWWWWENRKFGLTIQNMACWMWRGQRTLNMIHGHVLDYPTPISLTWSWNWGSLAGIFFVVQVLTGMFLAMHYDSAHPFESVMGIIYEVPGGAYTRIAHQNGATFFFAAIYVHMWRSFLYGSYVSPRRWTWVFGCIIYVLAMATAFLGYVLPWGQMSYWGATVITNLVSVVPYVGQDLVNWLWGGYYVSKPTLNRFYSLHYMLPMLMLGLIVGHLGLLHMSGSSNPLRIPASAYQIPFTNYYLWKDMAGFIIAGLAFLFVVGYNPTLGGYSSHHDNMTPASPLYTPSRIVPEWYFLWIYAMLRSVPSKIGGIIVVCFAILGLFMLPSGRAGNFVAWQGLVCFLFLTWLGEQPLHPIYMYAGQFATIFMLWWLFVLQPLASAYGLWVREQALQMDNNGNSSLKNDWSGIFSLVCICLVVLFWASSVHGKSMPDHTVWYDIPQDQMENRKVAAPKPVTDDDIEIIIGVSIVCVAVILGVVISRWRKIEDFLSRFLYVVKKDRGGKSEILCLAFFT